MKNPKPQGIFYSPTFVVEYILAETAGKILAKASLAEAKALTVLDPSCGDGAFLVGAYDFLLAFYQSHFPNFSNPEQWIVKHQIFGVDLDAEAIQICQNRLFKKSGLLCPNLKIGDALNPQTLQGFQNLARSKAKGFRLIVGNPPYVDIKTMPNDLVKHYFKHYETAENRINLYAIFIERALQLLQENGTLSFIVPNSLLVNSSYLKLRKKLYKGIETIVKMPDNVFEDANVETIIFTYQHNQELPKARALVFPNNFEMYEIEEETGKKVAKGIKETDTIKYQFFDKKNWNGKFLTFNIYADDKIQALLRKCFVQNESLADFCDFSLGITPYDKYKGHSQETIENRVFHAEQKLDETYKPCLSGANILRYFIDENVQEYLKYGDWLGAKREERFFTSPRIIIRQILSGKPPRIFASFTDKPLYFTQIAFAVLPQKNTILDVKYLLALLNSKLLNFIHTYKFTDVEKEIFGKILIENCKLLPIQEVSREKQQTFIDLVNILLAKNEELHQTTQSFVGFLKDKYQAEKLTQKLEKYYFLEGDEFLAELKKAKIKTSLKVEKELRSFFEEEKQTALNIYQTIQETEKELDTMIYELYGLDAKEVEVVAKF